MKFHRITYMIIMCMKAVHGLNPTLVVMEENNKKPYHSQNYNLGNIIIVLYCECKWQISMHESLLSRSGYPPCNEYNDMRAFLCAKIKPYIALISLKQNKASEMPW